MDRILKNKIYAAFTIILLISIYGCSSGSESGSDPGQRSYFSDQGRSTTSAVQDYMCETSDPCAEGGVCQSPGSRDPITDKTIFPTISSGCLIRPSLTSCDCPDNQICRLKDITDNTNNWRCSQPIVSG